MINYEDPSMRISSGYILQDLKYVKKQQQSLRRTPDKFNLSNRLKSTRKHTYTSCNITETVQRRNDGTPEGSYPRKVQWYKYVRGGGIIENMYINLGRRRLVAMF